MAICLHFRLFSSIYLYSSELVDGALSTHYLCLEADACCYWRQGLAIHQAPSFILHRENVIIPCSVILSAKANQNPIRRHNQALNRRNEAVQLSALQNGSILSRSARRGINRAWISGTPPKVPLKYRLTSGGSQTHSPVVRLAYMCSLVRGSMISTHSTRLSGTKEETQTLIN